jgi:HrpA-like RNA helicase
MADFQLLRDKLAALPVHSVIDAVVRDVLAGKVTVVAASTGSGKSMMLPSALADISDHRVVVLAPRRFLAIDAAFNVAELAGIKIGEKVGYALGQMDGESSLRSHATRLLYCTYGYAISSGLIKKAETIVLDEVHEADEQISLARAILRERKIIMPDLRILEMSATVDVRSQARYWHDIATTAIHAVEGRALECEVLHESIVLAGNKDRTAEEIAISLLEQTRKGIVMFRPGVREVESTVGLLKQMLMDKGVRDVDVIGIHGGTPSDERRTARSAPAVGRRKIIVGTNVIESGVNLRWLDAGISDGYRKIPYHRDDTGADALVLEDQPQAGLLQQIGRINRDPAVTGFERGLFVLHAKKPFDLRRLQNGPAIQREGLNGIAFQAASLGYDPTKLTWDITSRAHVAELPSRLEQAKRELMLLQLVNEDWSLTKAGEFVRHLPVSPETGAMLCEAKMLDEQRMREPSKPSRVMRDIVIIAAISESHGLRQDTKTGHNGDQHRTSDLLDGMNAFRAIRKEPIAQTLLAATESYIANLTGDELTVLQQQRKELEVLCLKQNVGINGFIEVARLSDEITSRLGQLAAGIRVDTRDAADKYDAERYGELQRCILNANANRLFIYENGGLRDLLRDYDKRRSEAGAPFNGYAIGHGSIVVPPRDGDLMVGELREVRRDETSDQVALIALTNVTAIPADIFINWAAARAASHQTLISDGVIAGGGLNATYAGKARFEILLSPDTRAKANTLIEETN